MFGLCAEVLIAGKHRTTTTTKATAPSLSALSQENDVGRWLHPSCSCCCYVHATYISSRDERVTPVNAGQQNQSLFRSAGVSRRAGHKPVLFVQPCRLSVGFLTLLAFSLAHFPQDTDAAARAPAEAGTVGAATAAARSSPKPAPDGNRRRGRGDLRRSRRRRSFDGALGGIARRSGLRPSRTGGGGGSGGFAATTEQHRERSSSCFSYFASGSVLVSALVTARPGGDGGGDHAGGDGDGDGDGDGRAAKTSVGNAAPSRQEWTRFNNRKEALTVSSDASVAAAAAAGESHGVGSTTAAGLAGEASASGGVGEAAADVGSTKSTETNADRRKLPLPLEPLAGRCWFEDCGKVSRDRGVCAGCVLFSGGGGAHLEELASRDRCVCAGCAVIWKNSPRRWRRAQTHAPTAENDKWRRWCE